MDYKRGVDELKKNAVIWWPNDLDANGQETAVKPRLLESRSKFVSLLKLAGKSPYDIFDIIETTGFSGNLFLKHLAVITDIGGEGLQRIGEDFRNLFPLREGQARSTMKFIWHEEIYEYEFQGLPLTSGKLTNKTLHLDGAGMQDDRAFTAVDRDVAILLLHGASNLDSQTVEKSDFFKCTIGSILGMDREIDEYVSERYIWVSRITGGATANLLGQLAQNRAFEYLKKHLEPEFEVKKNGTLNIQGQTVTSDILICLKNGLCVGVEVSFQVTTNSTIERKGNEAENRMRLMHGANHAVAYIIDGAGMFQRKSAVRKLCENSDCTVAFSEIELSVLCAFVRERLK